MTHHVRHAQIRFEKKFHPVCPKVFEKTWKKKLQTERVCLLSKFS